MTITHLVNRRFSGGGEIILRQRKSPVTNKNEFLFTCKGNRSQKEHTMD